MRAPWAVRRSVRACAVAVSECVSGLFLATKCAQSVCKHRAARYWMCGAARVCDANVSHVSSTGENNMGHMRSRAILGLCRQEASPSLVQTIDTQTGTQTQRHTALHTNIYGIMHITIRYTDGASVV